MSAPLDQAVSVFRQPRVRLRENTRRPVLGNLRAMAQMLRKVRRKGLSGCPERMASPLPLHDTVKHTRARQHDTTAVAVAFASEETPAGATVAIPVAGVDLEAVERALIVFALAASGDNRTRAARFLGLSRSALIYRMHKHGLAKGPVGSKAP